MAATHTFARLTTAGQGRRLFLLSWIAYAAAYVGRYNYSAVMSAITAEGTLTLSAAGAVSTGYFVCYAAGQILCGILSQKCSPFGMIPLGLVLSAGCNFGMGFAPAGAMPLLWAANGLFQAMVWPPIVRLFAECMPFEQQDSACVSINSTTPRRGPGAGGLADGVLDLRRADAGPGLPAGAAHGGESQPAGLAGAAGRHHRPDAGGQHHVHQCDAGQDRPQQRRGRPLGQPERHHLPGGLGAAIATWGIGAAAEGFGWGAVFVLWAVMAGTALAVCLLLARPWGRFVRECETERGDRV